MNKVQDVYFNVTGQSLYWDALEGRASSVTSLEVFAVDVDDDQTAESALTGAPAVETNPNTTIDAATAAGTRTVYVAATTGITKGRRYLLTNADGDSEWVEPINVDSGASFTTREPLVNTYAAADTLVSTRITDTFLDAWVQDESNVSAYNNPNPVWRARIEYVVSSVTYVHAFYFDLVRYKGGHNLTGFDVDDFYPGWLNALPTYDRNDQGARLISSAYTVVQMMLHANQLADQMARNPSVVDYLVIHQAAMEFNPEKAEAMFKQAFEQLIIQPKIPFDDGNQGGSSDAKKLSVWGR